MLAHTLIERARRRKDEDSLAEARTIYTELRAENWLAHIDSASGLAA
jgi:hypothetical protein